MPRIVITVPEKTPQPYRFALDRETVTLGRGSESDVVIDSGSVSANHATMQRVKGGYELRDSGSTNGFKVNGLRQEVVALRDGMSVEIGEVLFDFSLSDEEKATMGVEKARSDSPTALPPEPEENNIQRLPSAPPRRPMAEKVEFEEETEVVVKKRRTKSGLGFFTILCFLILVAAAFIGGLAIRYGIDTGGNLIDAIQAKAPWNEVIPKAKD